MKKLKEWHNKFGARIRKPQVFSYRSDLDEEDLKMWKEDEKKVLIGDKDEDEDEEMVE